jgi:hypothetical protein
MTEQEPIEDPYEHLRKQVSKGSSSRSGNFDKLTSDQQKQVLGFVKHLEGLGWTKATVASYKSYVVCALVGEELTNDRKSGLRKFFKWLDGE